MSRNRLFTLIEMLVVIAIIAILAALLFPAMNSAVNSARTTNCQNNLKHIGYSVNMYADSFNSYFPVKGNGSLYWFRVLGDLYLDSKWPTVANTRPLGIWACPASIRIVRSNDFFCSDYGKNPSTGESPGSPGTDYATSVRIKSTSVRSPGKSFFAVDSRSWSLPEYTGRDVYSYISTADAPGGSDPRHNLGMINLQYIDTHIATISPFDPQLFPTPVSTSGSGQGSLLPWSITK